MVRLVILALGERKDDMIQARVDAGEGVIYVLRFFSAADHNGRHRIKSIEIRSNSPNNMLGWRMAADALSNAGNADIGKELDTEEFLTLSDPKISANISSPLIFADAAAEFLINFTTALYPGKDRADLRKFIRYLDPHRPVAA